MDQEFKAAVEKAKAFTKRPDDLQLLELYGLYKQAEFGDNNIAKPGIMDMKGRAKWEAWNGVKGMSKDEARKAYIDYVDKLSSSCS